MIKYLPAGAYRLRFGALGRNGYRSDAYYQIRVEASPPSPENHAVKMGAAGLGTFIPNIGVQIQPLI